MADEKRVRKWQIRWRLRKLDRAKERIRDRAGYLPLPTIEAFHQERMVLLDELRALEDDR